MGGGVIERKVPGYKSEEWEQSGGSSERGEEINTEGRKEGTKEGKIIVRMPDKVIRNHTIYYLSKSPNINMHMQFEFSFLMWAHNCPSKNQRTPHKNHHEKPSFELLLRIVQETSKHKAHRLLLLPSVACPGGRLPVAEDITCTSDLEAPEMELT